DYGKQKFELNILDDENCFQNSLGSYENLERDFSELKDLWYDKFGYRINSIISTVQVLETQLNERYSAFFEPYEFNVPVFEIQDLKNKKIKDIRKIFERYLFHLVSNYLNRKELHNTFWTLQDITDIVNVHRSDWKSNEVTNILKELGADQSAEFHLGENKLANRLYYPLDQFSLFFYIISYPGALRERLYAQTSKLDDPLKEFILINHIKRILKDNHFKIHPLSGKQIIDDNRRTLGEIDIVATLDKKILLFIESKIMLQKKIDVFKIRDFNQHMKNIVKEIKKFDRNLGYFSNYCGNKNSLTHFLNYSNKEVLFTNNYEIKKIYFITPLSNLLSRRIKNKTCNRKSKCLFIKEELIVLHNWGIDILNLLANVPTLLNSIKEKCYEQLKHFYKPDILNDQLVDLLDKCEYFPDDTIQEIIELIKNQYVKPLNCFKNRLYNKKFTISREKGNHILMRFLKL
ncbi:hypothetical protein LCGC14_1198310, partial [marine sediment metagenome]